MDKSAMLSRAECCLLWPCQVYLLPAVIVHRNKILSSDGPRIALKVCGREISKSPLFTLLENARQVLARTSYCMIIRLALPYLVMPYDSGVVAGCMSSRIDLDFGSNASTMADQLLTHYVLTPLHPYTLTSKSSGVALALHSLWEWEGWNQPRWR
eukprot:5799546-Pyramimonas_sp.AAC.1